MSFHLVLNRSTFIFCTCVGHGQSSPGIENQGSKSNASTDGSISGWGRTLKLNAEKTQLLWLGVGTRQQLAKMTISQLPLLTTVSSYMIGIVSTASNLGVTSDGPLTMTSHISSVCRTSFFQLHQLRTIRRSLTPEAKRALVQVSVSCRLDYCNSLLAGVADVHHCLLVGTECGSSSGLRRSSSIVMTTSRRSSRHFIGFQFVSE